jgi:hypothetical protein
MSQKDKNESVSNTVVEGIEWTSRGVSLAQLRNTRVPRHGKKNSGGVRKKNQKKTRKN